ncbi:MAG: SDR family NAD(P)-dependent oxidoreductase [Pirellulales bacterium]
MDLLLDQRVVLLVGGNGSIGRAAQDVLRGEGATVVVADHAATGCDGADPYVVVDVTDAQSVRRMVDAVSTKHGRLDGLVVLSAIFAAKPAVEISADEWDEMLGVNLKGTFLVCREVLPHMQQARFGRIVLLSSLAAQIGGAVAGAHYSASKGAVLALVKSLARQARRPAAATSATSTASSAEIDITVNAISPGPVESAMTAGWTAEERARMTSAIPAGRFAEPREIADVIAWLLSPRTAYIHGARIDVNGGALMA